MMNISLIVAMDNKGVIGVAGGLPWHLSADLQYFKKVTMGKPLIMGRKTHESIGRPLPGRHNIVLSRDINFDAQGCTVVSSLDAGLRIVADAEEIMIMGGASLYAQTLAIAKRIYITEVHTDVAGDIYFPAFDHTQWSEIQREKYYADKKNDFDFSFVVLTRVSE